MKCFSSVRSLQKTRRLPGRTSISSTSMHPTRSRSGQNSENYRWLLLLLQQDLVATGSMGGEPHNPLKVPIEFSDIRANRFEYQS